MAHLDDPRFGPLPNQAALQALFWQSPIPFEWYDAEGKWMSGNKAAYEIFGINYEEIKGFELFTDEAIPSNLRAALKRGEEIRFSTPFDFSTVTYETSRTDVAVFEFLMTPTRDKDGVVIGFLVQTIDITDR